MRVRWKKRFVYLPPLLITHSVADEFYTPRVIPRTLRTKRRTLQVFLTLEVLLLTIIKPLSNSYLLLSYLRESRDLIKWFNGEFQGRYPFRLRGAYFSTAVEFYSTPLLKKLNCANLRVILLPLLMKLSNNVSHIFVGMTEFSLPLIPDGTHGG